VNNPLGVKENYEHALEFALYLSRFLSVSVSLDFPCTAQAFFLDHFSNHCQGLRHTFSEFCTKFDAVPLWDTSRNRTRQDKRLQIKGRKESALPFSCLTDFQIILALSSTLAQRYYNYFTDGSTSPGYYGYSLVEERTMNGIQNFDS
jgi:putative salt-induced outer membrane protein YdiY